MKPRYTTLWRIAILALYLLLTCYQLGLPGLHYDEAKEAGVNAVELLTGASVTAFRGAKISLFGKELPLMVQDYIGALNVYLALPFLKLSGIGVPNLRGLSVLTGLATLLLLERVVREMERWREGERGRGISHFTHHAPLLTITLLAVSPSFVFWSRQGIFVTNLTQPLTLWAIWQGLRWLRTGRTGSLAETAFASGLAIYAKLLAIWVLIPFWVLVALFWMGRWGERERGREGDAHVSRFTVHVLRHTQHALVAAIAFLIALSPLILFNLKTGGTFSSVGGNLTESYYGVNNLDIVHNFDVRIRQLIQVLRGDQFDYLGGTFSNWLAPWLAIAIIAFATVRNWRLMMAPLLLLGGAFAASLFTVSGLFVTHYALMQPVFFGLMGVSLGAIRQETEQTGNVAGQIINRNLQFVIRSLLVLWFCFDLTNTIRYHQMLTQSGGLGDHSDASYHLAYHLRYNGMGAPIALDWGIDASVRYLSENTVRPIEIFGYASLDKPDEQFVVQLAQFLENPDNRYLLRAPDRTVFAGRREAFLQAVQQAGRSATLEATFSQRNGAELFELWRVRND